MASVAPIPPHGSLQRNRTRRNSFLTWCARKSFIYSEYISLRLKPQHFNYYGGRANNLRRIKPAYRFLPGYLSPTSLICSWRQSCSIILSAIPLDYDFGESMTSLDVCSDLGTDTSYIDYLRHILHESASTIAVGLKNHPSSRNYPKLAKAWVGVDVEAWHGRVAYQAAVYALLKSVLVIGELFNNHSVYNILFPKVHLILQSLDGELSKRDPKLVKWFRMEQLPALTKCLTLVLERCASHYVESGSEVSILAISCCVTIKKLGAARISCPAFTNSLRGTIWELVESSHEFSSIDIVHHLATKAGVEHELLTYFGPNILDHDARGNIIFWMGLLQEKIVAALCRESVITILQLFCHSEIAARDLAVIGLFAFLGRKTRLFLAQMGIKDLDEPVKDFICYLESGILFIYPELSSLCAYQLFMDVVNEEIGWLDLYAAGPSTKNQERKRSKQQVIQAEKEIILSTVFGVCSDMFSSFTYYSEITAQSPNPNVLAYIHVSMSLLTICLEDYWAAYDKLRELRKTMQIQFPEPMMHTGNLSQLIVSFPRKQYHQRHEDLKTNVTAECTPQYMQHERTHVCLDKILEMLPEAGETKLHQNFLAKYRNSLLSSTYDICMGTKLLFIDVKVTIGFIQKLIIGQTLTKREKKKISRTLIDIVCVIPIAILMLIPVTAIGHAAMLTAIKKYIPDLIPSPYSAERLDVIKQLKRAKKMKVLSCSNPGAVSLAY